MTKRAEELEALISLLDDPDGHILDPVVERLMDIGMPAISKLEKTWEKTEDPSIQARIENIILQIQKRLVRKDLKDWADCRGDELFYGAYLIARSQYPELSYTNLDASLDLLRSEIWLELNNQLTALEKVRVINHFLFSVHKFNRSIRGVLSPQLFLVNHVMDTKKGLPITLSIIYAELARRLELPIYPVDLPHNFLLCYYDPTYLDDPDGILFYINPYTQGTVLGRPEVEHFLSEQKLDSRNEYFKPCSNIDTILRLSEGLRYAYDASRMEEKGLFIGELIELLKNYRSDHTL